MKELPGGVTQVDIETTGKHAWQAGQHVYLRLTKLNPFVGVPSSWYAAADPLAITSFHHRVDSESRPRSSHTIATHQDSGRHHRTISEVCSVQR
jgi:hypothetical protein